VCRVVASVAENWVALVVVSAGGRRGVQSAFAVG
jgi:hypothetical protein